MEIIYIIATSLFIGFGVGFLVFSRDDKTDNHTNCGNDSWGKTTKI